MKAQASPGTAVRPAPQPTASVIILTWNSERQIGPCLASIDQGLGLFPSEVIVVDNGSRDQTCATVRETRPDAQLLCNPVNRGVALARNQGIRAAEGEYVVMLDDDTLVHPGALDCLIRYMEAHPEVGLCGPKLTGADGELQLSCRRFPTLVDKLARRLPAILGRELVSKTEMADWDHRTVRPVDYVIGACQVIRRRALQQVGLFDERIFYGPEDVDMCLRLQQAGWPVVYNPEAVIVHEERRLTRSLGSGLVWQHLWGLCLFFRKHRYLLSRRRLYARLARPGRVAGVANGARAPAPATNPGRNKPVDFLIVGAAKSGTTTLFESLKRHPGIFIPQRKECRYFSCMPGDFVGSGLAAENDIIVSPEEYRALFKKADPDQLWGDVSPDYLYYHQKAVPKILREVDARIPIIIILRNPIDRAYSNYLMKVQERREPLTFEAALDAETERLAAHWAWAWGYVESGLYAEQVKTYLDSFERVLILLFEEDVVTGRATGKVLDFLNLSPTTRKDPDQVRMNASGYPKNRALHWLMTDELVVRHIKNVIKATPLYAPLKQVYWKVMQANLKKEAMAAQTRQRLKERFQEDVALLAQYTGLPVRRFWKDFR